MSLPDVKEQEGTFTKILNVPGLFGIIDRDDICQPTLILGIHLTKGTTKANNS